MHCDVLSFDVPLEKALGLSQQLQRLLGEPSRSPANKVTKMVPVGDIMGSFPAGGAEAGSLQCTLEMLIRFPEQTTWHRSDRTPGLPACP